jgi:hypothetical protein
MNTILFFIYNFYYTYLFFSTKESNEGEPSVWKDHNLAGFDYFWYFLYLFIVFICSTAGFGLIAIVGLIITLYVLIMPLFMTANVVDGKKSYSLKDMYYDVLKYKKQVIMFFASYYLLISANSSFGTQGLIWAILACIIVYIFFPNVYKQYIPKAGDHASNGLIQEEKEGGNGYQEQENPYEESNNQNGGKKSRRRK